MIEKLNEIVKAITLNDKIPQWQKIKFIEAATEIIKTLNQK